MDAREHASLAGADSLPVVVIGAGPVGLVSAAHLLARGLRPLVLEAGDAPGSAVRQWGHIRMFTPWRYVVDPVAATLLDEHGWRHPPADVLPTGRELLDGYVAPLAAALGEHVRLRTRVVAVSRDGCDRGRGADRESRPFLVRVRDEAGRHCDRRARAVIDASGTWGTPNPLGASGLPAIGEDAAVAAGNLAPALPDVLGADRARFAGRTTLVAGSGHSAANTLIALAQLAREVGSGRVLWAIRRSYASGLQDASGDPLAARGQLSADLRSLVAGREVLLVRAFSIERLEPEADGTVTVLGDTADGPRALRGIDVVVAATGFRPDHSIVSELRLDLDPVLEAPTALAPLIDPESHICSTVPPHGHRELSHREPGFFIVGMKSYGRAPTFLVTTANEQVRSVTAALAGDLAAADEVRLVLPEIGAACRCCADAVATPA
ncbi:MAG: NAD(P)-binding protein [Frankiaceae bacterium]